MDNEKLIEIKNDLYRLPGLEERLKKLINRIRDAENDVSSLLHKFEAESKDVDQLQKESLSSTLLRLIGRYDGKLDKEMQEMIDAKMAYDKASERVKELYLERDDLSSRISLLRQDQQLYETELDRREKEIKNNITDERSIQYNQLETDEKVLYKQLVETDEAMLAANKAKETAKRIIKSLDSAENWATYDIWFKSGIISHMAKYSHIDDAEADFNRLSSNMKDLQRELRDVNLAAIPEMTGIDSTTRAIDFWFDNIFTDLNVRNRIRNDSDQAAKMVGIIQSIITKLEENKSNIQRQLSSIEQSKDDLIILG